MALYEENSHFLFPKEILALHQMSYLDQVFINNLPIPIFGYEVDITIKTFLVIVAILILGFGLYLPFLNKVKFFFLEKYYSFYSLIYLAHIIIGSLNKYIANFYLHINYEFCELLIYNLIVIDVLDKVSKMKKLKLNS